MIRYYPASRIIPNQNTNGNQYALNGQPYTGKYYTTYDGKVFSGANPQVGPSDRLFPINTYAGFPTSKIIPNQILDDEAPEVIQESRLGNYAPIPFYPKPNPSDYSRGYIIRYFTKKENQKGFVIEISEEEYNSIVNGTATYDISIYQTTKILWKITGPLRNQRKSQYNTIPGIIDTNQRLTETANKTFLGILDFIGGDYTKFARPTTV